MLESCSVCFSKYKDSLNARDIKKIQSHRGETRSHSSHGALLYCVRSDKSEIMVVRLAFTAKARSSVSPFTHWPLLDNR